MYIRLTLKIEQARANCAILTLLSRLVCSSDSDESGIATQSSGIILSTALQLRLPESHLIQRTWNAKHPFCRRGCSTEYPAARTLQRSWQSTPLISDIVLLAQSMPVCPFQCMP